MSPVFFGRCDKLYLLLDLINTNIGIWSNSWCCWRFSQWNVTFYPRMKNHENGRILPTEMNMSLTKAGRSSKNDTDFQITHMIPIYRRKAKAINHPQYHHQCWKESPNHRFMDVNIYIYLYIYIYGFVWIPHSPFFHPESLPVNSG